MRTRVPTLSDSRPLACFSFALALWLATSTAAAAGASRPKTLDGFSTSDRLSLSLAFGTAAKKVQKSDTCRALFDGLDFNGAEALERTFYEPAKVLSDLALCERGTVAITGLQGRRTRLCGNFKIHSLRDQVGILIHEALHVAGLSEKPVDPNGMTPHQINQWVKKACGL